MPKIPHIDFSTLRNSLEEQVKDNDFALFNDLSSLQLGDKPERMDSAILIVCVDGSWKLGINLKEYLLEGGSVLVTLPEQILQSLEVSEDFSALFIVVSRPIMDTIFPQMKDMLSFFFFLKDQPNITVTNEEMHVLVEYYSMLFRKAAHADNFYKKEICQGIILSLFYEFYNLYRHKTPHVDVTENRKEEVFEQFLRVLSETFRKERSVNYYANKLFLTSKHLSRVVKEISGKTAGEWIDDFVILEAKALLRSSERSIQEISEALHFANQSFFGKYFKHHTGMSPKEYRRQ